MKKIIIITIAMIMIGSFGAYSQNANRKGAFLELQGGGTLGYLYKGDQGENYMKGGFDAGLSFGCRFPTSLHWAFQMKLTASDNLSSDDLEKSFLTSILFGMRWISSDFATNKSAYIGLGVGYGVNFFGEDWASSIPIEIETGINLTPKIYLGVFANPRIYFDGAEWEWDYSLNKSSYYQSNTVIGLKLGVRF